MATLSEVLENLRGKAHYRYDVEMNPDGPVKIFYFWYARDSDYPEDIDRFLIRILVKPDDTAIVYTTRGIEQIPHDFRDALITKLDQFLQSNPDYQKYIIHTIDEANDYGDGIAIKDTGTGNESNIINWAGFIKKGETEVILRIIV